MTAKIAFKEFNCSSNSYIYRALQLSNPHSGPFGNQVHHQEQSETLHQNV